MSTVSPASSLELSRAGRWAVLAAAFLGLVFDGFELGLMPVASNSVAKSLWHERSWQVGNGLPVSRPH